MTTLSPNPRLRFFDANGAPLSGGKLYTYVAGTTTNKSTYSNYSGSSVNTNPVILDSQGYADVRLGSGAYKYVLKNSSNVTQWTVDYVNSIGGLFESVKDYGAVGDGVTDDTVAIQAALNASKYVFFPSGTYFVSSTLTAQPSSVIQGESAENSVIYRTGNYGSTILCGNNSGTSAGSFICNSIWFRHSASYVQGDTALTNLATSGAHIELYGAQQARISNCKLWRLPYSIIFRGGSFNYVTDNTMLGIWDYTSSALQEGVAGIFYDASTTWGNPKDAFIYGNGFTGANSLSRSVTLTASDGSQTVSMAENIGTKYGIYATGIETADISGNYFGAQGFNSIFLSKITAGSIANLRIYGNFFDSARQQQIYMYANTSPEYILNVAITGNVFNSQYNGQNAVVALQNGSSPVVYGLTITGNTFLSAFATPIIFTGAVGFEITGNTIANYNCRAVSVGGDLQWSAGIYIAGSCDQGKITANTIGGGGNTFSSGTSTNYCYNGVSVDPSIQSKISRSENTYNTRTGSNFRSGNIVNENIIIHTTNGLNYQMTGSDQVVIVNKSVSEATTVALPAYPVKGRTATIKDGQNVAATYNLTVNTADSTNIDGAATSVITTNYGYRTFVFNGTQWNRIV